jgi:N-acetylmuramoyl-L-alanine amidase
MKTPIVPHPSPNFDQRGLPISMLVVHFTHMHTAELALQRLCDPASKVSAHYLIAKTGEIFQLVDEANRAWHAGVSSWRGEADVNSASIGIELDYRPADEGPDPDYDPRLLQSLVELSGDIVQRYAIAPRNVVGHGDVAPGRKVDPGVKMDWPRLARHGVGLWIDPPATQAVEALRLGDTGPAIAAFQKALSSYGYGVNQDGVFDQQTLEVVSAFQRHFRRQKVDGVADAQTQTLIYALCRAAIG